MSDTPKWKRWERRKKLATMAGPLSVLIGLLVAAGTFVLLSKRNVSLEALPDGLPPLRCAVCGQPATRAESSFAEEIRRQGYFEYLAGYDVVPVYCARHKPKWTDVHHQATATYCIFSGGLATLGFFLFRYRALNPKPPRPKDYKPPRPRYMSHGKDFFNTRYK